MLAAHLHAGQDAPKAFRYLVLAGDAALDSFANQEAERHYRRALDLARGETGAAVSLADGERADLLAGLGEALDASWPPSWVGPRCSWEPMRGVISYDFPWPPTWAQR